MSRRPVDKTAQNQQTLKSLVKLEANKTCADCKKNKHPRWASWNLGVFVCIRCSGIHRGMGTHISRVKSVDLDAWTDEQLQSVLLWGNARANKYWESKLAPGHVPSEAKIENFIRTKYESKRWVMDGPMPDPSTLDADGDDDVPLNVVQEKAKLDRSASQRATSSSSQPAIGEAKRNQNRDLIGDSLPVAPLRPNTTEPAALRSVPPKAEMAPPKQMRPGESLLGLDFLGGGASTSPVRSASTLEGGLPSGSSRPDLKQSILSLYSSAPKSSPKPTPQSQNVTKPSHARAESFGAPQGPGSSSQSQSASRDMTDAFGDLKFDSTPVSSKPTMNFPALSNCNNSTGLTSSGPGPGGSFFDPPASKPPPKKPASIVSPDGFGDFLSSTSGPDIPSKKPAAESLSADLFDFSGNSTSMASQPPLLAASATSSSMTSTAGATDNLSAFNLSSVTNNPAPTAPSNVAKSSIPLNSEFSNMDAWGSTDAWSASKDASANNLPSTSNQTQQKESQPPPVTSSDFGWGDGGENHGKFGAGKSSSPIITQDEDFGGWNSSEPIDSGKPTQAMTSNTSSSFAVNSSAPKPVANFSGDDLFSNVWQ